LVGRGYFTVITKEEKMAMLKIVLSPEQRQNLLLFMQRVDLKGTEVPAYMELVETIAKARPETSEVKKEEKDDTGDSGSKPKVQ
jgi:hypothetical protein